MGFPSLSFIESRLSGSIQRNERRRVMLVLIEMLGKSLDSNVMLVTHLVHVYVAGLDSASITVGSQRRPVRRHGTASSPDPSKGLSWWGRKSSCPSEVGPQLFKVAEWLHSTHRSMLSTQQPFNGHRAVV